MPSAIHRRHALAGLGLTLVGLRLASCGRAAARRRGAGSSSRARHRADLHLDLRHAARDDALDLAGRAIAAGLSPQELQNAIFRAAVEDVRPRPHGILHCVMMSDSAARLAAPFDPGARLAWHPALFNLDDLKRAQERDRREDGDYRMQPLAARRRTAAAAQREFVAAMAAPESERAARAEQAVVDLHPHLDAERFFELLRPVAAGCYAFIGHKQIYALQVERSVAHLPWEQALPALRSLVLSLLVDRDDGDLAASRAASARVPDDWEAPPSETDDGPQRLEEALAELRVTEPEDGQAWALAALGRGLRAQQIWDALELHGSEVFHRRPGRRSADGRTSLLPVHAVTVPGALRSASLVSPVESTRRLLLLQASAWLPRLRMDLARMVDLVPPGAEESTALGPRAARGQAQDAGSLAEAFTEGSPGRVYARLRTHPGEAGAYRTGLIQALARVGLEHHQHKYAAAMLEAAERVAPAHRARLLAPAVDYLAHPADHPTAHFERAEEVLSRAGLPG